MLISYMIYLDAKMLFFNMSPLKALKKQIYNSWSENETTNANVFANEDYMTKYTMVNKKMIRNPLSSSFVPILPK